MPPTQSIEDEIADKYEQCRRKTYPTYSVGNRHDEHWKKAAEIVRRIGADPRLFVEAQFRFAQTNRSQPFPHPSQMHGDKALEYYNSYIERFQPEVAEEVACQFAYLANFIHRVGLTIDEAVANPRHPFRPFFRILVCTDEQLPSIQAAWLTAALHEVESSKDLRIFLNKNHGYRAKRLIRQELSGEAVGTPCEVPPPTPITRDYPDFPGRF